MSRPLSSTVLVADDDSVIVTVPHFLLPAGSLGSTVSITVSPGPAGVNVVVATADLPVLRATFAALAAAQPPTVAPSWSLTPSVSSRQAEAAGFREEAVAVIAVFNAGISGDRVRPSTERPAVGYLPAADRWLLDLDPPVLGCRFTESRRLGIPPLSGPKFWRSGPRVQAVDAMVAPLVLGGVTANERATVCVRELRAAWGVHNSTPWAPVLVGWPFFLNDDRSVALCAVARRPYRLAADTLLPF